MSFSVSTPLLANGEICYTTPITPDVEGFLSEKEVEDLLNKIKQLPKDRKFP